MEEDDDDDLTVMRKEKEMKCRSISVFLPF